MSGASKKRTKGLSNLLSQCSETQKQDVASEPRCDLTRRVPWKPHKARTPVRQASIDAGFHTRARQCGEAEEQARAEGSQTSSEFRRGDAAPGKCAVQLAFSPSSSLTSLGPQGVDIKARGEWKSLPAPLDHINLHVRGGYVLPWQEPAQNTHFRCVTSHLAQVLAKPSWAPKQLY